MIRRFLKLPKNYSYFLFGPRHSGKSTLIFSLYDNTNSIVFNLLDSRIEERFLSDPMELSRIVSALPKEIKYVVLDEIQKVPKLLDIIHLLIESTDKCFIMTGSSARKLKHGAANLLAGRAFVFHLYPFSFLENEAHFNLAEELAFGSLPRMKNLLLDEDKINFLYAYAHTYLKEEIVAEQAVRNLDPFRKFLEIAAQCNGKIINFSNIANDVGIDDKTIKKYYSILEDTLIGFFLEGFVHSFRKRLSIKPKFYFFDIGVVRSLSKQLTVPLLPKTSYYGDVFEHFVILECMKLATYFYREFTFSYLKTKDDVEVDLVVERPGLPLLFIEIKSSDCVTESSLSSFVKLSQDFGDNLEAVCFSNDQFIKIVNGIKVYPWQDGIKHYFCKLSQIND